MEDGGTGRSAGFLSSGGGGGAPLINVNVKTLSGSDFELQVPPDILVSDLKVRVRERTEVEESRQRLIFRGKVLNDTEPLTVYKVETGQSLHMVARPRDVPQPTPLAPTHGSGIDAAATENTPIMGRGIGGVRRLGRPRAHAMGMGIGPMRIAPSQILGFDENHGMQPSGGRADATGDGTARGRATAVGTDSPGGAEMFGLGPGVGVNGPGAGSAMSTLAALGVDPNRLLSTLLGQGDGAGASGTGGPGIGGGGGRQGGMGLQGLQTQDRNVGGTNNDHGIGATTVNASTDTAARVGGASGYEAISPPSLEPVRQGLLTLHTLLSSRSRGQGTVAAGTTGAVASSTSGGNVNGSTGVLADVGSTPVTTASGAHGTSLAAAMENAEIRLGLGEDRVERAEGEVLREVVEEPLRTEGDSAVAEAGGDAEGTERTLVSESQVSSSSAHADPAFDSDAESDPQDPVRSFMAPSEVEGLESTSRPGSSAWDGAALEGVLGSGVGGGEGVFEEDSEEEGELDILVGLISSSSDDDEMAPPPLVSSTDSESEEGEIRMPIVLNSREPQRGNETRSRVLVEESTAAQEGEAEGELEVDGEVETGEEKEGEGEEVRRRFYVGQWLDVKDTVNQWLEATVMGLSASGVELNIHYNGWPSHWDEWMRWDSPRIAPFRTRTLHLPNANHVSPAPVSVVRNAPSTGVDDVRLFLPEVSRLLRRISPMVETLATCYENDPELQQDPVPNASGSDAPGSDREAQNLPWSRLQPRRGDGAITEMVSGQGLGLSSLEGEGKAEGGQQSEVGGEEERAKINHAEAAELAADVAPLLDRLGRMLADVAPHVAQLGEDQTVASVGAGAAVSSPAGTVEAGGSGGLAPLVRGVRLQRLSGVGGGGGARGIGSVRRRREGIRPVGLRSVSEGSTPSVPRMRTSQDRSSRRRARMDEDEGASSTFRRLVSTSSNGPTTSNIDIHIHAIVPLRSPHPVAGQPAMGTGGASLVGSEGVETSAGQGRQQQSPQSSFTPAMGMVMGITPFPAGQAVAGDRRQGSVSVPQDRMASSGAASTMGTASFATNIVGANPGRIERGSRGGPGVSSTGIRGLSLGSAFLSGSSAHADPEHSSSLLPASDQAGTAGVRRGGEVVGIARTTGQQSTRYRSSAALRTGTGSEGLNSSVGEVGRHLEEVPSMLGRDFDDIAPRQGPSSSGSLSAESGQHLPRGSSGSFVVGGRAHGGWRMGGFLRAFGLGTGGRAGSRPNSLDNVMDGDGNGGEGGSGSGSGSRSGSTRGDS